MLKGDIALLDGFIPMTVVESEQLFSFYFLLKDFESFEMIS